MTVDRSSPTWLALAAQVEARIEELKDQCCGISSSDATRAACAARIDELRRLLAPITPMAAHKAYRSESY